MRASSLQGLLWGFRAYSGPVFPRCLEDSRPYLRWPLGLGPTGGWLERFRTGLYWESCKIDLSFLDVMGFSGQMAIFHAHCWPCDF